MLAKTGEVASSKSAMKTLAPEFSALTIILRSTGPVISTRRSRRSAGIGATRQSPSRMAACLGQEVGRLAGVEQLLALDARGEQLAAALVEASVQVGEKGQRLRGENFVEARALRTEDSDARRQDRSVECFIWRLFAAYSRLRQVAIDAFRRR